MGNDYRVTLSCAIRVDAAVDRAFASERLFVPDMLVGNEPEVGLMLRNSVREVVASIVPG